MSVYLKNIVQVVFGVSLLCYKMNSMAGSNVMAPDFSSKPSVVEAQNPLEDRQEKEEALPGNFFALQVNKPNYILPYYYSSSPDTLVYSPNNQSLNHQEVKFQLSFKIPLWKDILQHPSTLYFGYSQLSYWQLYQKDPFFRETDYEPEIYLSNIVKYKIFKDWELNEINLGAVHESNGFGGSMERSWNRLYVEAKTSIGNWMFSFKPWYVLHDSSLNHNPNIAHYLGYGSVLASYKLYKNLITLEAHNLFIARHERTTGELTWSFPLAEYFKGYVQVFSGYGQSLIEYNHKTTSIGVGVALNDWI